MGLTEWQRELLISGYTRTYYKRQLSSDILLLLSAWFDAILRTIVSKEYLYDFVCRNGKNFNYPIDKTHIIQLDNLLYLECTLHAKSTPLDDSRIYTSLQWVLKLCNKDPNIKASSIYIYMEYGCEEMANSAHKETKLWRRINSGTTHILIPSILCKTNVYANQDTRDTLSFYLDAQLIRYNVISEPQSKNKMSVSKYYITSPLYSSHIEYKWIFNYTKYEQVLDACSRGEKVYHYSPEFMNGHIGMYFILTPGYKNDRYPRIGQDRLVLKLQFLRVPLRCREMAADIQFVLSPGDDAISEAFDYRMNRIYHGAITDSVECTEYIKRGFDKDLNIKVIIDLIRVYDEDREWVEKCDWRKYGIDDKL